MIWCFCDERRSLGYYIIVWLKSFFSFITTYFCHEGRNSHNFQEHWLSHLSDISLSFPFFRFINLFILYGKKQIYREKNRERENNRLWNICYRIWHLKKYLMCTTVPLKYHLATQNSTARTITSAHFRKSTFRISWQIWTLMQPSGQATDLPNFSKAASPFHIQNFCLTSANSQQQFLRALCTEKKKKPTNQSKKLWLEFYSNNKRYLKNKHRKHIQVMKMQLRYWYES